jgi:hypothetical protein
VGNEFLLLTCRACRSTEAPGHEHGNRPCPNWIWSPYTQQHEQCICFKGRTFIVEDGGKLFEEIAETDEAFIERQVKSVRQQVRPGGQPHRIAIQHMGDAYDEEIARRLRQTYKYVKIVGAGWFYISAAEPGSPSAEEQA